MTKHCIVGLGEVGSALKEIFKADGEDPFKKEYAENKHYDYLHICIPYTDYFIKQVQDYQKKYTPKYTIIHSTVPIGTSLECNAHHSPVRGVHPNLVDGILTFKKFMGGPDCFEIAKEFGHYRITCMCTREARNTEALKLIDTTQYGNLIMMQKEIYNWCLKYKLDYNLIYTLGNETYNEGYTKLFRPDVVRPFLKHMEGKIGGHCVENNAILLNRFTPIPMAKHILDENKKL